MISRKQRVWIIFFGGSLLLSAIFFLFPINLFDGVIIQQNGMQTMKIDAPLSLSYFIGLGYEADDMIGVKDFYLTGKGIFMAILFIFGFPALLAYRYHLKGV